MRVCLWSRVLITSYSSLYFKWLEVAASKRAFGFVYLVLAGTSEGHAGPRILERTCSIGWEIVHSENSLLRWRWGHRASCSNLKTNLSYLWLLFYFSLNSTLLTLLYILHTYTCLSLYVWYCFICLHLFITWKQLSNSTLI